MKAAGNEGAKTRCCSPCPHIHLLLGVYFTFFLSSLDILLLQDSCEDTPTHTMLSSLKTLLLLSVVCSPSSGLCLRLSNGRSSLLCDHQMAIGFRGDDDVTGSSPEDGWGRLLQPAEYLSSSSSESESREKRTYNPAKSRFQSRVKLGGPLPRNSLKGARRSRLTLSLDVPTNIMSVLFDVAKAQNQRAKAAENARLLAQIGRRK
ncbi:urocortin 3, like [Dunckerocampus dactyliophorus]|uniref:urocortin 3, like n=1 Tax=Dunckerocampus dactyliophorus TaxID=161453 RepID=UPI002406F00E|nr:urocortin 3, like [Dunckerocampus dactyliophorus]